MDNEAYAQLQLDSQSGDACWIIPTIIVIIMVLVAICIEHKGKMKISKFAKSYTKRMLSVVNEYGITDAGVKYESTKLTYGLAVEVTTRQFDHLDMKKQALCLTRLEGVCSFDANADFFISSLRINSNGNIYSACRCLWEQK